LYTAELPSAVQNTNNGTVRGEKDQEKLEKNKRVDGTCRILFYDYLTAAE